MYILAPNRFHTHGQRGTLDIYSRNGAGCVNDDILLYTDDTISFFFNTSNTLSNTGHKTVPLDNNKKKQHTILCAQSRTAELCVLGG